MNKNVPCRLMCLNRALVPHLVALFGKVQEVWCWRKWGWTLRGKESRHFQHALLCARALGLLLSPPGLLLCFPTMMVVGFHFSAAIRPHKPVSPSISCLGHGCSVTATGKTNVASHRQTVCVYCLWVNSGAVTGAAHWGRRAGSVLDKTGWVRLRKANSV